MKRIFAGILASALFLSLAGCSAANTPVPSNDAATSTTTNTTSTKSLPELENTVDETALFYTGDLSADIGNQRLYSLSNGILRYKEWSKSADPLQTDSFSFQENPSNYIEIEQNVVEYWVSDGYIFCFKENGAFSLVVNASSAVSYPLTLPEELTGLEKQDVFGFEGSRLLGGLVENADDSGGPRRLFVYDLNTGKLTWLTDGYVSDYSAALLNGVVYYSYADLDAAQFCVLAYDIASDKTTTLHEPIPTSESVLTYLTFFDRSILLTVCSSMNSGDPPTYKLWNVDDSTRTWNTVHDAVGDGYRVVWRENDCAYVLPNDKKLKARTDSLAPLSRYDYSTGAVSPLLYLPYGEGISYSYLPEDDAVYCRIGSEWLRFAFPTE